MPVSFEGFKADLRQLLLHLHDPSYEPSHAAYRLLGCEPDDGPGPLQAKILAAIQDMEPDPETPSSSRTLREFDALYKRFVVGLNQEQTADSLHMSVRNVQRVQAQAIHALTQRLWEREHPQQESAGVPEHKQEPDSDQPAVPSGQAADWKSQADLELASLRMHAPNAVTDISRLIRDITDIEGALLAKHGVNVTTSSIQPGLIAAIHPSAIRQTLIIAVAQLAQHMLPGQMSIHATLENAQVKITMSGSLADASMPAADLVRDIIAPADVSVEAHRNDDHVFISVRAPCVGEHTVLVVEDNLDMVYFYRRCTAGTTYRIVHAPSARGLAETVEVTAPDIIVLDVMLPEVDGWQLLTELRGNPACRSIPIIVCSVTKAEQLALSLGASIVLSKPIRPQQFVNALEQALDQGSTGDATDPANSEAFS